MKNFIKELYGFWVFYRAQRRLRKSLPAVFEQVDQKLPELLTQGTAVQAERLIGQSLKKATGKKAAKIDIDTVIKLYSPIEAIRHRPKS